MICSTSVLAGPRLDRMCVAAVRAPGDVETHVQETPGSTSVTSHTRCGNRGCLIRTRVPTATPDPSISVSDVTDAVHSGHRSTSLNTSQTRSIDASIVTPSVTFMYQMVHEGPTAWQGSVARRHRFLGGHTGERGLDEAGVATAGRPPQDPHRHGASASNRSRTSPSTASTIHGT